MTIGLSTPLDKPCSRCGLHPRSINHYYCSVCRRDYRREWNAKQTPDYWRKERAKQRKHNQKRAPRVTPIRRRQTMYLDPAPLWAKVSYYMLITHYGVNDIARALAARFDVNESTAKQRLSRLRNGERVHYLVADEMAVFLGLHPSDIYPDWFDVKETR